MWFCKETTTFTPWKEGGKGQLKVKIGADLCAFVALNLVTRYRS